MNELVLIERHLDDGDLLAAVVEYRGRKYYAVRGGRKLSAGDWPC